MIVRFYEWPEFLESLKTHPPEDRTVWLTFSLRSDECEASHVLMLAGYRALGPMEFVDCLGLKPTSSTNARASEIQRRFDERRKELEDLGFLVRSGRSRVSSSPSNGSVTE